MDKQNTIISETNGVLEEMSEDKLKEFLEKVKADTSLQEKLKAAVDADAVVVIAKAAGFVISADELQRAQADVSDEELEKVAGGLCWWTTKGVCKALSLWLE